MTLFSVDEVMKKIRALQIQYSRELKKVLGGERSGSGTDQLVKSNWCFFKALDASLRPHVTIRPSKTNVVTMFYARLTDTQYLLTLVFRTNLNYVGAYNMVKNRLTVPSMEIQAALMSHGGLIRNM